MRGGWGLMLLGRWVLGGLGEGENYSERVRQGGMCFRVRALNVEVRGRRVRGRCHGRC